MAKKLKCPIWFKDEEAISEWKRMYKFLQKENKDFTDKDEKALELYAAYYGEWKKDYIYCQKYGNTVTVNKEGYEQNSPEYSNKNKANEYMMKWQKELLATPAARNKLNNNNSNKPDYNFGKNEKDMEGLIS